MREQLVRLQLLGGRFHGWTDHLRCNGDPWPLLTVGTCGNCTRMHVLPVDEDQPGEHVYRLDRDAWEFDGHEHHVAWYKHEDLDASAWLDAVAAAIARDTQRELATAAALSISTGWEEHLTL